VCALLCPVLNIAAQLGNKVIFYPLSLQTLLVTVNSCNVTQTILSPSLPLLTFLLHLLHVTFHSSLVLPLMRFLNSSLSLLTLIVIRILFHTSLSCSHILLPTITNIINPSLSTGLFPEQFKNCSVHPHLKKSHLDKDDLVDYRPIYLLSFLSKLTKSFFNVNIENSQLLCGVPQGTVLGSILFILYITRLSRPTVISNLAANPYLYADDTQLLLSLVAGQLADKPNRGQPNRGLVNSRTGQFVDWSTRELDNSWTTGQLADWLKFQFFL